MQLFGDIKGVGTEEVGDEGDKVGGFLKIKEDGTKGRERTEGG